LNRPPSRTAATFDDAVDHVIGTVSTPTRASGPCFCSQLRAFPPEGDIVPQGMLEADAKGQKAQSLSTATAKVSM
jgi:hypothetical protein